MFDLKLYSNPAEIKAKWAGPMTIFFPICINDKQSYHFNISFQYSKRYLNPHSLFVCLGQPGQKRGMLLIRYKSLMHRGDQRNYISHVYGVCHSRFFIRNI